MECAGQGDERSEALVQFFIARCDAAEVFNAAEVAFNEIAVLILMPVIGCWRGAVGARRNDRFRATLGDVLAQLVSVKGFIGEHRIGIDVLQQRSSLRNVMCLPLGQDESGKVAQALDQRLDLGVQSAPRAPDRLRAFF